MGKLAALEEVDAPKAVVKPCSLKKPTQDLVKLIFNNDMFKEAMQSMEIGKSARGGGGGGGGRRDN